MNFVRVFQVHICRTQQVSIIRQKDVCIISTFYYINNIQMSQLLQYNLEYSQKTQHLLNAKQQLFIKFCFLTMNSKQIPHLVYFNCRGSAHYLRYVLYEIGIQFQEIHLNYDGIIPEELKKFNISFSDIPCIIYNGRIIKDLYPTIRYFCNKSNRQDLLGNNLKQQTRISEIYNRSAKKKSNIISIFLKYVPRIKKEPQNIKKFKIQMLNQLSQCPGSTQILSILYSQTGGYVFDHLTVADFLLYENCYYYCNFFDDVCRKKTPIYFAYKNFFERTDFYQKHKERIESFKFVVPEFNSEINEGFKLMWKQQKSLK